MSVKYTKAVEIAPRGSTLTLTNAVDAVYIGSGNFTDYASGPTFYSPTTWFRSQEGVTPTSAGTLTAWEGYAGTDPDADTMATVNVVDGNTSTNMQNYVHFTANDSHITTNDNAAFNIGTGEFEMMAVVRFGEATSDLYQHIASRNKASSSWSWIKLKTTHGSGDFLKFSMPGSPDPLSGSTVPFDTWLIVGVSRNSSNEIQMYRNGATDGAAVTNAGDLDTDADDNLILGAISSDDGSTMTQSLRGDMLEFILWETSLSTAERADVVQHLQDRYFNEHRAQITSKTDSDATTVAHVLKVGEVHELNVKQVTHSHTYADDIVGLRKE